MGYLNLEKHDVIMNLFPSLAENVQHQSQSAIEPNPCSGKYIKPISETALELFIRQPKMHYSV